MAYLLGAETSDPRVIEGLSHRDAKAVVHRQQALHLHSHFHQHVRGPTMERSTHWRHVSHGRGLKRVLFSVCLSPFLLRLSLFSIIWCLPGLVRPG